MDLAAGGAPFYSMAYALSGVMAGVFHRQGRLCTALAYVLSNAVAVLWTWGMGRACRYSTRSLQRRCSFLLLPERSLRRVRALLVREPRRDTADKAREYARKRLEGTARAFRELHDSLRSRFDHAGGNDGDTAIIFDRAANRVCKTCPQQIMCWQRSYVETHNALNDALPCWSGEEGGKRLSPALFQPVPAVRAVSHSGQ